MEISDVQRNKHSSAIHVEDNFPEKMSDVLRFWRAVEFFSPQSIPKSSPTRDFDPVFEINECSPIFPWEELHLLRRRKIHPKKKWQHLVYCAIYPHSLLKESLQKKFGDDKLTFDERMDGESCVFAFTVSETGRPLFDTFNLSSSAWGLSQIINFKMKNSNWLDNFEKDKDKILVEFENSCKLESEDYDGQLIKRKGHNIGKTLLGADLIDLVSATLKNMKLELGDNLRIRVKSIQIDLSNRTKSDDQDFLNSFFINDLKKVSEAIDKNDFGKALRQYLASPLDVSKIKKIDVRKEPWQVFNMLKPELFPQGRWPSLGHHPLVLSQQFAVNAIFKTLACDEGGIFAVNGPPGTGKTTLLRDLISTVIVERAKILEKYDDPAEVFSKQKESGWKSDNYKRIIAQWPKEFNQFSIVVSSSNNGAVENISLEIPGKNAIDPDWELHCDYFKDLASSILQEPAWGLIAARLGNKSNRHNFIQKFWYGPPQNDDDEGDNDLMTLGGQELSFLKLLKKQETSFQNSSWKDALKNFRAAIEDEKVFRNKRDEWHCLLGLIQQLKVNQDLLIGQKKDLVIELNYHEKEANGLGAQKLSIANKLDNLNINYSNNQSFSNQLSHIIKISYQTLENCVLAAHILQENIKEANTKLVTLHTRNMQIAKELQDDQNLLIIDMNKVDEEEKECQNYESSLVPLDISLSSQKEQRYEHRRFYPKLLSVIITLGKAYKYWNGEDQNFIAKIKETQKKIFNIQTQQLLLTEQISTAKNKVASLRKQIDINENLKTSLLASCQKYQVDIKQFKINYIKLIDLNLIILNTLLFLEISMNRCIKVNKKIAKKMQVKEELAYIIEQKYDLMCTKLSGFRIELTNLNSQLEIIKSDLLPREKAYEEIKEKNANIPDLSAWLEDNDKKNLSSPWADKDWNLSRAKVFLQALNLHKAFILNNADVFRKNLHAMVDILNGVVPVGAPEEGIKAAWLTLFFVVPVISTTFASFDRLFKHYGKEDIGWLLIDEAGQATPQSAVGGIWRSKRVVVVGDPLQLEPVVTLPITAQQALRKDFKVDEIWIPSWSSVQKATDRITSYGTLLTVNENSIWVGAPLRVHRRCDNPMFRIANEIAYDGLMVYGTAMRQPIDLRQSHWFNVIGQDADGHYVPEEGKELSKLLDYLTSNGCAPNEIFLISPFKQVVSELYRFQTPELDFNIGTIHTTQGKEANVVIMVLGGNQKSPGAKKWASQTPNLLNVAITRAKRRLYIIGNRPQWKNFSYFDVMAKNLSYED